MTGNTLSCVVSAGGPLILLPSELTSAWRGTLPPENVAVPDDWSWGQGGVVCDYDRACDPPASTVTVEDSTSTWSLAVGAGTALVLDGENATTAVLLEDGLVLLRDANVASEADALAIHAGVEEHAWFESPLELALPSGRFALFDAAYAGFERDTADGGLLEAHIAPGTYRVVIATAIDDGGGTTTLIRLVERARTELSGRTIAIT